MGRIEATLPQPRTPSHSSTDLRGIACFIPRLGILHTGHLVPSARVGSEIALQFCYSLQFSSSQPGRPRRRGGTGSRKNEVLNERAGPESGADAPGRAAPRRRCWGVALGSTRRPSHCDDLSIGGSRQRGSSAPTAGDADAERHCDSFSFPLTVTFAVTVRVSFPFAQSFDDTKSFGRGRAVHPHSESQRRRREIELALHRHRAAGRDRCRGRRRLGRRGCCCDRRHQAAAGRRRPASGRRRGADRAERLIAQGPAAARGPRAFASHVGWNTRDRMARVFLCDRRSDEPAWPSDQPAGRSAPR